MIHKRIRQVNEHILQNMRCIYRFRKIQATTKEGKEACAYAISLVRTQPQSLEMQVLEFYELCKAALMPEETLVTENRCFKILSDTFVLVYCLEAWRKRADKVAYMQDGQVKIDALHRMSCEQASKIFRNGKVEPFALLEELEALKGYTNPADKYVALAKMMKFLLPSGKLQR